MSTQSAFLRAREAEGFVSNAAHLLQTWITESIKKNGKCVMALCGGTTPRPVYTTLGQSTAIDWSHVWICLTDERFVDPTHADSNQRLARETLLANASIPADHIIMPETHLPLMKCLHTYESDVLRAIGKDGLDIVVLGMGEDGHTVSLFPPVTDEGLTRMGMVHTTTDRFAVRDRIGMALPLLQDAKRRLLLLSGEGKHKLWDEMLSSTADEKRWPVKSLLDARTSVIAYW